MAISWDLAGHLEDFPRVLKGFWAMMCPSWAFRGPSWELLSAILESLRALESDLGADGGSRGHHGAILELLNAFLGLSRKVKKGRKISRRKRW